MTAAITVEKLTKRFGSVTAVDSLSFSVPRGALFGIAGADGAGKSTLIEMLATLVRPDGGEAACAGFSLTGAPHRIRAITGYMPQRFSLYGDLSVLENINFYADIFNVKGSERTGRIRELLEFSRLAPFVRRPASKLSGGMKQKLALCCALVHTPTLLLLDEPTTGVDPVSRNEFWDILANLRGRGVTIVIATPYMDELMRCDELLFLHEGSFLAEGNPARMLDEFKGAVWRISGSDPSVRLSCSMNTVLPDGIDSIYPSAGVLHAVTDAAMDVQTVHEKIMHLIDGAAAVNRTVPEMEDLFFRLLLERTTVDER